MTATSLAKERVSDRRTQQRLQRRRGKADIKFVAPLGHYRPAAEYGTVSSIRENIPSAGIMIYCSALRPNPKSNYNVKEAQIIGYSQRSDQIENIVCCMSLWRLLRATWTISICQYVQRIHRLLQLSTTIANYAYLSSHSLSTMVAILLPRISNLFFAIFKSQHPSSRFTVSVLRASMLSHAQRDIVTANPSVCPSVRPLPVFSLSELTYRRTF